MFELRVTPDWLLPHFPWEQHFLKVNGQHMAYIDEGDPNARPVLLLHGNPTWGFLYRFFVDPLTNAGYRVIVPDFIGAGYSDHPRIDSRLTLAHHIADLVSLIDQLRLRGFVIVGQDWGGPQGIGAALQRIERLDAIVLMNTWLYTTFNDKPLTPPWWWMTPQLPLAGSYFMIRNKWWSHGGVSRISKRGMTDTEARGYDHVFDETNSEQAVLCWPHTVPKRENDRGWGDFRNIEERLHELSAIPALLLWAPEDGNFSIQFAHRLKELLPHAEGPLTFDRAAHFLQDDRGPDLADAIVEFLDRKAGASL
ncbi:MAG: alpha/beta fold hydrolase [Syntrophales bacterium]|jgi:haloalkane dehalogenase|nr:alpha/beta fold hydrolase [Syntrophales bacterium]MDY0044297.1 alpha/beta fold hydrolase [Syntrophales bacterium]